MITKVNGNKYGVVQYAITSIDDVEKLPKQHISTGSSAMLVTPDAVKLYSFNAKLNSDNEEIDGAWIEINNTGTTSSLIQPVDLDFIDSLEL